MPYDKPETIYPGDGQDSVKEAVLKNDTNVSAAFSALNDLEVGQSAAEILSKMLDVDGATSGLDADFLDGKDSTEFAGAVHTHEQSEITDLVDALSARYLKTEHIDISAGVPDAGKPIVLNGQGQIDPSMLDVSTFYYVGPWDPSAGTEYPDTSGEVHGAFWVVQGLTADYTFTGGDLTGQVVSNGDFMVWSSSGWSIMTGGMDPSLYYLLDGSQAITAPFQAGGNILNNVGDGTAPEHGVNKGQMDAGLALKLNADAQAVDSALLEGHPASYFAKADGAGYLPLSGGTLTGNLIVGDQETYGSVGVKNNDPAGKSSFILRDNDGNPRGTFYSLNSGYVGMQRQAPDQSVAAEFTLEENGNVSVFASAPVDPQNLTRKDYVDGLVAPIQTQLDSHEAAVNPHGIDPAGIGALPVDGKAVDAELLDGKDSSEFAASVHGHLISEVTDLQDALTAKYDKTDHIAVSAGAGDAGKPIILNSSGEVDPSMISIDSFHLVGDFTPAAGAEYPDTTGQTPGAFWIVAGLGDGVSYTFAGGDLAGESVIDGNFMVLGSDGWSLIKSGMNPQNYYKLDGTQAITADFAGGGFKIANIADGTEAIDAVSKGQMDTALAGKLGVGDKAADSMLLDGQNINYFAKKTDLDGYLPLDGVAADSTLFAGHDSDFYAKATDLSNYLPTSGTAANSYLLEGHGAAYFAASSDLDGYLPVDGVAADSYMLGGVSSASYSLTSHNHDADYLAIDGKAADSSTLDGLGSMKFSHNIHQPEVGVWTKICRIGGYNWNTVGASIIIHSARGAGGMTAVTFQFRWRNDGTWNDVDTFALITQSSGKELGGAPDRLKLIRTGANEAELWAKRGDDGLDDAQVYLMSYGFNNQIYFDDTPPMTEEPTGLQEKYGELSGIGDADTLDGLDSTQFVRCDVDSSLEGVLSIQGTVEINPTLNLADVHGHHIAIINYEYEGIVRASINMSDSNVTINKFNASVVKQTEFELTDVGSAKINGYRIWTDDYHPGVTRAEIDAIEARLDALENP